jgi:DNA-binding CsgD family transcriptional regulator
MDLAIPSCSRSISDALLALYSRADFDSFSMNIAESIKILFPECTVSIDEVFFNSGEILNHGYYNYPSDPRIISGWTAFSHQHPGVRYVADGGKESVLILTDFISFRQLRQLDLYNESYKLANFRDQAALILPRKQSILAIAIGSRTPINGTSNSILDFLYPHFLQAQQNAFLVEPRQGNEKGSGYQYLELYIDKSGQVNDWPDRVRRILTIFFIYAPSKPWAPPRELLEWIRDRHKAFSEGCVSWRRLSPLCIKRGRSFLNINLSLTPDQNTEILCLSWKVDEVDVLPEHCERLTKREHEVSSWIGRGKSNGEIALILGISLHTVRKHVEHIFDKLGVENRVALALSNQQR